MLATLALIACAVPVLIVGGMAVYVAFDVLVCDMLRGFRDLYLERCEERLQERDSAHLLLMPYISWSDTVAHSHTHTQD